MWPWTKYPYTNFQELNLDYILNAIRRLTVKVETYKSSGTVNPAYPSVADMVADTDIVTGSFVSTVRYHAGVEGGGATYEIVDTLPSTYYETMDDGRYAKLVLKDEVDVKQFGAYGDNVHDDRQAFQYAVNSGKLVIVPFDKDEIYRIDGIINIGGSATDCIKGNYKPMYGRIHFDSGYFNVTRYNMRFENLFIEGRDANDFNTYLIYIKSAGRYDNDASIINCVFRWAVESVHADGRGRFQKY